MDPRAEFGSFLRDERQQRGVPLEHIVAATKIPLRSLEQLEQGSWQNLPAQVFVCGFVRAYGRELGIEADALQRFNDAARAGVVAPAAAAPPTHRASSAIQTQRRFGLALVVILLLIFVTITVSMLWSAGPRTSRRASLRTPVPAQMSRAGGWRCGAPLHRQPTMPNSAPC